MASKPTNTPEPVDVLEMLTQMRPKLARLQELWQSQPEMVGAISDVHAAVEALVPVVKKQQGELEAALHALLRASAYVGFHSQIHPSSEVAADLELVQHALALKELP